MSYPKAKIGKIAKVSGGKRLPKGECLVSDETDHPYIRAQDIRDGRITFEEPVYLPEVVFKKIKRYTVKANDVCITIVGVNVGDVGIVPSFLDGANLTENAVKLTELKDCDPRFLNYSLLTDSSQSQMKLFAGGAAQPKLGLYKINEVEIPVPPLPIQRKIAAILSAYDDLIENNTRRIKILEEMARTLYREWFVEFRAPGVKLRKATPEEKKVTGKDVFPVGWEIKPLGDTCHIVMGQSPKSEFYNQKGEGLPFHQGVTDFGDRFLTDRMYCTVQNRIAETGDVLFSVRAPVGRINIANKRIVIGRGLCAIRSKTGHQPFVFQQLKEQFQEEDMMGGGTIFKSVTKEDMHGIKMIAPPEPIVARFAEMVNPIFAELEILTAKNTTLRRTRDLLLPRLVSGELDVENVEVRMASQ
jgi:type I restriction enzyme S subunit